MTVRRSIDEAVATRAAAARAMNFMTEWYARPGAGQERRAGARVHDDAPRYGRRCGLRSFLAKPQDPLSRRLQRSVGSLISDYDAECEPVLRVRSTAVPRGAAPVVPRSRAPPRPPVARDPRRRVRSTLREREPVLARVAGRADPRGAAGQRRRCDRAGVGRAPPRARARPAAARTSVARPRRADGRRTATVPTRFDEVRLRRGSTRTTRLAFRSPALAPVRTRFRGKGPQGTDEHVDAIGPSLRPGLLTHLHAGLRPLELNRPQRLLTRHVRRALVLAEREDRPPGRGEHDHREHRVPGEAGREHEHPAGDVRPAERAEDVRTGE